MTMPPVDDRADVRAQRRRVHRDQRVDRVAGRENVGRGEMDLEAGDARERPGRGSDLGRKIRQR
jgi:hypothetical protein